jgi:hypothetical protein
VCTKTLYRRIKAHHLDLASIRPGEGQS